MRMLGCLEMRGGWFFRAKHVRGVANVLADSVSRWGSPTIAANLCASRPDINWQEQHLGATRDESRYRHLGLQYVGGSVASSSKRTYESGRRSSRKFRRLGGCSEFLESSDSDSHKALVLIEFSSWCSALERNLVNTFAESSPLHSIFIDCT